MAKFHDCPDCRRYSVDLETGLCENSDCHWEAPQELLDAWRHAALRQHVDIDAPAQNIKCAETRCEPIVSFEGVTKVAPTDESTINPEHSEIEDRTTQQGRFGLIVIALPLVAIGILTHYSKLSILQAIVAAVVVFLTAPIISKLVVDLGALALAISYSIVTAIVLLAIGGMLFQSEIAWYVARHSNTEESYHGYVSNHGSSRHSAQASLAWEELFWQRVTREQSRGAFGDYVSTFPNGQHRTEAEAKLTEFKKQEDEAADLRRQYAELHARRESEEWRSISSRLTFDNLSQFLTEYKESSNISAFLMGIHLNTSRIKYSETRTSTTVFVIDDFLTGDHGRIAKEVVASRFSGDIRELILDPADAVRTLIRALYWVSLFQAENPDVAVVVNMSWELPSLDSRTEGILGSEFEALHNLGIAFIAASGNEAQLACPFPASSPAVTAVAAVSKKSDSIGTEFWEVTDYANFGPKVSFCAPDIGSLMMDEAVNGLKQHYLWSNKKQIDKELSSAWVTAAKAMGTSFASPQVAGVLAATAARQHLPPTRVTMPSLSTAIAREKRGQSCRVIN